MTSEQPPRGRPRPRPRGFDDVPELSDEEVERRVGVRAGAAPRVPIERTARPTRPARREERTTARDSLLLVGLVVVGLVAVRVFLPDGPMTAASTSAPSGSQAAVVTSGPTSSAAPATLVPVITLPPGSAEPSASVEPSLEPTVEPTVPGPTPTLRPGETPRPTPRTTPKPTTAPTPGPTALNRATLIVVMHVVNNNGASSVASDWRMHISGEAASGASVNDFAGSESGRSVSIPAGAGYSVVDDASQAGYARYHSGDCFREPGLGLAAGSTATCTITENDRPRLLVITDVTNDDGGTASPSDWAVTIVTQTATPKNFSGSGSGVSVILGAGLQYTVTMSGPADYDKVSTGAACSGSLGIDDPNATCTIAFDDVAPSPTVLLPPLMLAALRPRRWRTIATD